MLEQNSEDLTIRIAGPLKTVAKRIELEVNVRKYPVHSDALILHSYLFCVKKLD